MLSFLIVATCCEREFFRCKGAVWLLFALLLPGPALAQGVWTGAQSNRVDAAQQAEFAPIAYQLPAGSPNLAIDEVAALPVPWPQLFSPNKLLPTPQEQGVWLHIRLDVLKPVTAKEWVLDFSPTYTDQIEVYTRPQPGSGWVAQSAGDGVLHSKWPIDSLTPRFYLPAMGIGQHDVYVRVFNNVPLHLAITLGTAEAVQSAAQKKLLVLGVFFGLMLLMAALAGVMAVAYGSLGYVWCALYAVLALLATASLVGVGGSYLWPEEVVWGNLAPSVFAPAAAAVQLLFCRSLFLGGKAPKWLHSASLLGALLSLGEVGAVVVFFPKNTEVAVLLSLFGLGVCGALMLLLVLRAALRRDVVAIVWAVAFFPLVVVVVLAVLDGFGIAAVTAVPPYSVLLALSLELPLLMLAVQLHSKHLHFREVRDLTLSQVDPLTGFVAAHRLRVTFCRAYDEAMATYADLSVAYVRALELPLERGVQPISAKAQAQRTVRMLRVALRSEDVLVRVDAERFAVLMPGVSLGDALSARLSRLVAQAVMHDQEAPGLPKLRFAVAVGSLRTYGGSRLELEHALDEKSRSLTASARRPISYVRKRGVADPDTATFEQMWAEAVKASADGPTADVDPAGTPKQQNQLGSGRVVAGPASG